MFTAARVSSFGGLEVLYIFEEHIKALTVPECLLYEDDYKACACSIMIGEL